MTEPLDETGASTGRDPARRRHHALVVALAAIAAVLAAACVVVAIWPTAVPGESKAEKANNRDVAVTVAATQATKAFLDVDYHDMDTRIAKVLNLSTGTFKNQYQTAKVDLKTQAEQAKAVATGSVRYVGIGDIGQDRAVVYVAADTRVSNVSIEQAKAAGKSPDDRRFYRFQLNLTKVGNRWLLNDLQFIS